MRVVVVAALSACSFEPGRAMMTPDDAEVSDAAIDAAKLDAAIDAAPDARVCPAAPTNCKLFTCGGSTSCYYVCGTAATTTGLRSWQSARDTCMSAGLGCLATINDQLEQDCIAMQTTPMYPDVVWIGLRQVGGSEPAGGWGWQCGTSSFTSWRPNEPNDANGDEDCGDLYTTGQWNDSTCSDQERYLCELP